MYDLLLYEQHHVSWVGVEVYCTDPAQHLVTAGQDLDDLSDLFDPCTNLSIYSPLLRATAFRDLLQMVLDIYLFAIYARFDRLMPPPSDAG